MIVPVSLIRYSCAGGAGGGLCTLDGTPREHPFSRNAPAYDTERVAIIGPILFDFRPKGGISDWPGGPAPVSGPASVRIGTLDEIILSNGQRVDFKGFSFGLYTDPHGTSLQLRHENNPGETLYGLNPLVSEEEFSRFVGHEEVSAVAFVMKDCEPCDEQKTALLSLRTHFTRCAALDMERHGELSLKQGVSSAPTLVLYRHGKKIVVVEKVGKTIAQLDACRTRILEAKR